jgi:hypothetical protein
VRSRLAARRGRSGNAERRHACPLVWRLPRPLRTLSRRAGDLSLFLAQPHGLLEVLPLDRLLLRRLDAREALLSVSRGTRRQEGGRSTSGSGDEVPVTIRVTSSRTVSPSTPKSSRMRAATPWFSRARPSRMCSVPMEL